MTLNTTWGYSDHDHAWKSDQDLIRNLIIIASQGGNYLLNIGPKGDGTIPEESIKSFQAIGKWMTSNGESIYGTKASPFGKLSWGRCTQKSLPDGNTRLFLHVFQWPKDGTIVLPPMANVPLKATFLEGGKSLEFSAKDHRITISIPANAPNPIATVIALDVNRASCQLIDKL